MTPEDITIAITVYDRRAYIEQAVKAALNQTLPVRVMVVEDCGPDETLQPFVVSRFGPKLAYYRNPRRRGLFDNWNACIDLCETPWLCICHDDDFLAPNFVEAIMELAGKIPDQGLYYGQFNVFDEAGRMIRRTVEPAPPRWEPMDLVAAALLCRIIFPTQMFRRDYVKALGGFRATSAFTGDWDMWIKLAARYGAARTSRVVANCRDHQSPGRGTTRVDRNGKFLALVNMQCKMNLALIRRQGLTVRFDRAAAQLASPVSARWLLNWAAGWSDRLLRYNVGLLLRSPSQGPLHFFFKTCARLFGPGWVKSASALWTKSAFARHPKER
jgi:glycosyltransferase involved in cell wall biosynthesis